MYKNSSVFLFHSRFVSIAQLSCCRYSELCRVVRQLRIVSPPIVDDAKSWLSRTDVAAVVMLLLLLLLLLLLTESRRLGLKLLQMLSKLSLLV